MLQIVEQFMTAGPPPKKKLVVNGRKLLFEETFCDGEIYGSHSI